MHQFLAIDAKAVLGELLTGGVPFRLARLRNGLA
jgi:hypothetical protein